MVGAVKGIGRVHLHAVADTHGSYAFGFLHVSKQPEAAVAVLHWACLRAGEAELGGRPAVLRQAGPASVGRADRQRPRVLRQRAAPLRALPGAQRHRASEDQGAHAAHPLSALLCIPPGIGLKPDGFVERFNGTVLEEFFRPVMHQKLFDSVEALQDDLDAQLHHDNHERPHLGYRNQDRRPWENRRDLRRARRSGGQVSRPEWGPNPAGRLHHLAPFWQRLMIVRAHPKVCC
jgi:hypothetical protein